MLKSKKKVPAAKEPVLDMRVKKLRVDINIIRNALLYVKPSREISLASTSLQRAVMWLGQCLALINQNPEFYSKSIDPKSKLIEPAAEAVEPSMPVGWLIPEEEMGNQTARVKDVRRMIGEAMEELEDFSQYLEQPGNEVWVSLVDSKMWLSCELRRIQDIIDGVFPVEYDTTNLPLI